MGCTELAASPYRYLRDDENRAYQWTFKTIPDLSMCSLQEAAMATGASFLYHLTVHPSRQLEVTTYLKQQLMDLVDQPFAPHVNLHFDASFRREEWMLEANNIRIGSPGC